VLGYQRGKAKSTGRPYEIDFVHLWSLRDGRLTEFQVFNDKAALVEALLDEKSLLNRVISILMHMSSVQQELVSLYDSSMQKLSVYLRAGIVP
jgi:hypothetical protein